MLAANHVEVRVAQGGDYTPTPVISHAILVYNRERTSRLADGIVVTLAGEPIVRVLTRAPGNDAPIGGVKVTTATGWFAARPSGTEDIYKICGESFRGGDQLQRIMKEAQRVVDLALESGASSASR